MIGSREKFAGNKRMASEIKTCAVTELTDLQKFYVNQLNAILIL